MGLDPDDDTYDTDLECTHCVDALFGGVTPQFVMATITGIIRCPLSPDPPPNGSFLLTQTLPCHWEAAYLGYTISWGLEAARSSFVAGAPNNWFFISVIEAPCRDYFKSTIATCFFNQTIGKFGEAHIFWGPGIPGPC